MGDLRQNRLSTWLSVIAVLISVAVLCHQVWITNEVRHLQAAEKRTDLLSRMGVLVAKLEDLESNITRIKSVVAEALDEPTDLATRGTLKSIRKSAEQIEVLRLDMLRKLSEIYRDGGGLSGDVGPEELEREVPFLREFEIRVEELTKSLGELEEATRNLVKASVN